MSKEQSNAAIFFRELMQYMQHLVLERVGLAFRGASDLTLSLSVSVCLSRALSLSPSPSPSPSPSRSLSLSLTLTAQTYKP